MLHLIHDIIRKSLGDSLADMIMGAIQIVAGVLAISIGLSAIGINLDFLPQVETTQTLAALIFLIAVAWPNLIRTGGGDD